MCQLEKGPYTVEPQGVVPGRGEEWDGGREGGGREERRKKEEEGREREEREQH